MPRRPPAGYHHLVVDEAARNLARVLPHVDRLVAMLEHDVADPYPKTHRSGAGEGSRPAPEDNRPTETQALNERTPADEAGDIARAILANLEDIDRDVLFVLGQLRELDKLQQPGRVSKVEICQGCGRDVLQTAADRIVHGYCGACDKQWIREGRPDRGPFNYRRRQEALQARKRKDKAS